MEKNFIHLHTHTEYSLLDGAAPVKKLVERAVELGMPALAMTDHGNMYATIKFYDACMDKKLPHPIKPIIGCEFYVTENMLEKNGRPSDNKPFHLVLLAKNNDGYRNLSKLCSLAWLDGFYYKPRIDLNLLAKYSENLICTSACLAGALPRKLLDNDYEGAKAYALKLKNMFAEGDFYIELQDHGLEEQKRTNPLLVKIAREIGVKCVATNDVHYINKDDSDMQDVLLCIQTGTFYDTPDRMKFPCDEFYLKTREEMSEVLGWCEEALDTPYEIADKCNVSFVYNQYQLPHYICPDNLTAPEYLRKMAYEGLERRYKVITPEIRERAETELNVICSMGFAEYYLIVWDFIFYAKSQDIPVGAGRGSGVGSIIAYAIGITNVDPLKYDLIFERFLNINRTSMPDFDIDFCYNRRLEVIDYVKRKYGDDHISQIITFGKLKRKAAIKDVARVFRLPYSDVQKLTNHIPNNFGSDDKKVHINDLVNPNSKFAVPELIEYYNNSEEYKRVIDLAIKMEGLPRNTSMHAAGVVIYKNPAADTVPLAKNGDEITTQFDMIEVEKLGLLKMDFLALMTLTDVKMAHDYVKARTGRNIDFEELGFDDQEVYNLIGSGNTDAVFQLEGGGMKKFMARFLPKNLEDIIAGISLYRPGPMAYIDTFLDNRTHPDSIKYKHPMLEPILRVTSGITVYQEQAMMITRSLAGYSMTQADHFRAIISKKKVQLIPEERDMFINGKVDKDGKVITPGCVRNGIPADVAKEIFADMESFASYAFNKSHAAAYAVLSYETAFYKRYYPVEFLAAVLNNRIGKPTDTAKYMRVLKDENIVLLQPDINKSVAQFSPDEGKAVRYGLSCIKNVGKAVVENIVAERTAHGDFKDFYDFLERMKDSGINKRAIESMIMGGAFDCFGMTRSSLKANMEPIMAKIDREKKNSDSNQFDIFAILGEAASPTYQYSELKEFRTLEKLIQEKDMLGMYVTGHPLEGYEEQFKFFNFNTSMLPKRNNDEEDDDGNGFSDEVYEEDENPLLKDGMEVTTGGLLSEVTLKRTKDGKEMAVCVLEDMYDRIELIAFPRTLASCKRFIEKDALVKITGKLSLSDREPKITAMSILPWVVDETAIKEAEETDKRILYINITFEDETRYDKVIRILEAHPGTRPVRVQLKGKIYELSEKITDLDETERELIGVVGRENVKVK